MRNDLKTKSGVLELFTAYIKSSVPFVFTKFGDAELFCIQRKEGGGPEHFYSEVLAEKLIASWRYLASKDGVFIGEWEFNAQPIKQSLEAEHGTPKNYVFFDSILFHDNAWFTPDLYEFYKSLKESKRKKLYIGNVRAAAGVKQFLNVDDTILRLAIESCTDDSLVMISGGPLGKLIASELVSRFPNIQYVDFGSALDPLFIGNTRATELDNSEKAKKFFNIK